MTITKSNLLSTTGTVGSLSKFSEAPCIVVGSVQHNGVFVEHTFMSNERIQLQIIIFTHHLIICTKSHAKADVNRFLKTFFISKGNREKVSLVARRTDRHKVPERSMSSFASQSFSNLNN
jgi:hypothetical protein